MEGPKGGHRKENGLVKDVSQCEHKKSTSYLALLISPASLAFASSVEFVTHLKLRQTDSGICLHYVTKLSHLASCMGLNITSKEANRPHPASFGTPIL